MKKTVKRYNLSNIMKNAWELVKKAGLCISEGLKLAWEKQWRKSLSALAIRCGRRAT